MIGEAIGQLIEGRDLTGDMAGEVMREIMEGRASQAQMGAFLTALRMKGETVEEITACARVMREMALPVEAKGPVMDIVGTGGDRLGTFNISTTTAFVAAAAGVKVAKHGNRSVSSRSGAADVLEKLGVNIRVDAEGSARALEELGLCFLFAPTFHASMRHAAPVRRELGVRTVFNILGPLANPAGAQMELMGVFSDDLVEPMARVLMNLGVTRGMVVCGDGRMDEATLTGPTRLARIRDGQLEVTTLVPEDAGLKRCALEDLAGGDADENARITRDILSGQERGPRRDVVLLNAALALLIAGVVTDLKFGVMLAAGVIDSGKAARLLESFARFAPEAAS